MFRVFKIQTRTSTGACPYKNRKQTCCVCPFFMSCLLRREHALTCSALLKFKPGQAQGLVPTKTENKSAAFGIIDDKNMNTGTAFHLRLNFAGQAGAEYTTLRKLRKMKFENSKFDRIREKSLFPEYLIFDSRILGQNYSHNFGILRTQQIPHIPYSEADCRKS